MKEAFICDAVRTPFGRYGGALKDVRADDLGAVPLRALIARNTSVDWEEVADVLYGCANQAGEDNRNVARMSALLAGLPKGVLSILPTSKPGDLTTALIDDGRLRKLTFTGSTGVGKALAKQSSDKLLRLSLSQTRESFRQTTCLTCCGGRPGVSPWVAR